MPTLSSRFALCTAVIVVLIAGVAVPAAAQFRPASDPATGERYHVEVAGALWNATPSLVISSEALGLPGDDVDLVTDLGIVKKQLRELRLVLRPAKKHKFRFNYLPMQYVAETRIPRSFVFNGQRYNANLPVNTVADLTTYRVGYEYDFVYLDRGYAGVLFDLKYTELDVRLTSPIGPEFFTAPAPIPTIGFVGRGYVVPNISITGEVSFFKVPENLGGGDFGGRYWDLDIYGTINFNDYIGGQVGYRNVDVDYFADLDAGNLSFKGIYFAGVLRF